MKSIGIIGLSVLVCVVLCVLVTLGRLEYAPSYISSAVLKVRPGQTSMLAPRQEIVPIAYIESLAAEAVSFTKSERVLQAAISRDEVRNTTWFQNDPDNAIQRLIDDLGVSSCPGSALVFVSMSGPDHDELPDIVNAVAGEAVARGRELATQGTQDQIRLLTTEKAALVEQRDLVRSEKAKLLRDADVPDMLDRTNVLTMRLHGLAPQVTEMELEYSQCEATLELIRKQVQSRQIAHLPEVIQAVENDPVVSTLAIKRAELRIGPLPAEGDAGKTQLSPADRDKRLAAIEKEIEARKAQLIDSAAESMLAGAEARKAVVLDRLTKLRDQYRFVDLSVRSLRATRSRYAQLDERDKALTEEISRIDRRLIDLRMLLKGNEPFTILNDAARPKAPSFPKWSIMLPLGAAVGLVIGLAVAIPLAASRRRARAAAPDGLAPLGGAGTATDDTPQ